MVSTKRVLTRARMDDAKRQRTTKSFARAVRDLAETKYKNLDVTHSTTTVSTTTLTDISAGDGSSTRDGRKIMTTSLQLMLTSGTNPMRVILYVPKNPAAFLVLTNWYDAIENDEVWVLHDKIYTGNSDMTDANSINAQLRMNRRLTVEYSDTGGTTAVRNPIKMLLRTPNNVTINGHTKVWYKDI